MSKEVINVFELKKPKSFNDLIGQSELIFNEIQRWTNQLREPIITAIKNRELISEDNIEDALHNISQNIIELCELIQKKVRRE